MKSFGLGYVCGESPLMQSCNANTLVKTVSPKRVVTMVHFTTISGYFLANLFNVFHKLRLY